MSGVAGYEQPERDYEPFDGFPAESHARQLERLTMIDRELGLSSEPVPVPPLLDQLIEDGRNFRAVAAGILRAIDQERRPKRLGTRLLGNPAR